MTLGLYYFVGLCDIPLVMIMTLHLIMNWGMMFCEVVRHISHSFVPEYIK